MIESWWQQEAMKRCIVVMLSRHCRMGENNVIRLAEPGTFVDGLTDVLQWSSKVAESGR
jgi:hypothetical protein